ncbi:MAG: FlgO family outer membrane protein [Dechloromonas sp.]|nr:FlgO family outer membrane protein [Dechloromonas sp.]
MQRLNISILFASLVALSACETLPAPSAASVDPTYEQAAASQFRAANYAATDALLKSYVEPASTNNRSGAATSAPFLVATLAQIDRLEQSSTFGRIISEQIVSRLTQGGVRVVEMKLRNGVYMKRNEGEFMLTREIREVANAHQAQAVVIGTYAESASMVHVSLKLVDPSSSLILAAHDYALPMDRQVRSMLRKSLY